MISIVQIRSASRFLSPANLKEIIYTIKDKHPSFLAQESNL